MLLSSKEIISCKNIKLKNVDIMNSINNVTWVLIAILRMEILNWDNQMILWLQSKLIRRLNHINCRILTANLIRQNRWAINRVEKAKAVVARIKIDEVAKTKIIKGKNKIKVDTIILKIRTDLITRIKVVKVDKTTKPSYVDILKEREIANMAINVHMHMVNKIWEQKDSNRICHHFRNKCKWEWQVWITKWLNSKEWWCTILKWEIIWTQWLCRTCKILPTCKISKTCKWCFKAKKWHIKDRIKLSINNSSKINKIL